MNLDHSSLLDLGHRQRGVHAQVAQETRSDVRLESNPMQTVLDVATAGGGLDIIRLFKLCVLEDTQARRTPPAPAPDAAPASDRAPPCPEGWPVCPLPAAQ